MPVSNTALQQAKLILEQAPAQNAYLLESLRSGNIDECTTGQNSVLLHDASTDKYLYAAPTFEEFAGLYATVRQRPGVQISLVATSAYSTEIAALNSALQVDTYHQLAPPPSLPRPAAEGIVFRPVAAQDAPWITQVYHHPEITPEFIAHRAGQMPNVVACTPTGPVGFYLMHSPAELGPVYVAPTHRASGLAAQLYAHILAQLPPGQKPVMFISPQNQRSYRWALRLGCQPAAQNIVWFWRKW